MIDGEMEMVKMDAWNKPTIKLTDLKYWSSFNKNVNENKESPTNHNTANIHFPENNKLNNKLCLSDQNIALIESDALVVPINEMKAMKTSMAFQIYKVAGSDFVLDSQQIRDMKTGDVISTPSCDLVARFAMRVMEPLVSNKYKTASETGVHNSYMNALELAKSLHIRTIAFPPLYTTPDEKLYTHMTHIALRTVRCYLDHFGDDFDSIIFSVPQYMMPIYSFLATVYFPRTRQELASGQDIVKCLSWNKWGACSYDEREIRVVPIERTNNTEEEDVLRVGEAPDEEIFNDMVEFTQMSGDHDARRLWQIRNMERTKRISSQQRIYTRLLRQAKLDDFSDVERQLENLFHFSSVDVEGHATIVVIGAYKSRVQPNKAIKYFIRKADKLVNKSYNLVYFCSGVQTQISSDMVKQIYGVVDDRYVANLEQIHIVHPTWFHKIYSIYFTTLFTSNMRKKLNFIKSLPQLYQLIDRNQIKLKSFILDYDVQINPHLYQVETLTASSEQPISKSSAAAAAAAATSTS